MGGDTDETANVYLVCLACRAAHPPELVSSRERCPTCQGRLERHTFGTNVPLIHADDVADVRPERPTHFRIEEGTRLVVHVPWFGCEAALIAIVCGLADAAIIALLVSNAPLWAKVWAATVMLVVSYYAVTRVANKTRIEAGAGRLIVTHGPFPHPKKSMAFDATAVSAIEVRRAVHQKMDGCMAVGPQWFTYGVVAVLRDGTSSTLLGSLQSKAEAIWLKDAIASRLGVAA